MAAIGLAAFVTGLAVRGFALSGGTWSHDLTDNAAAPRSASGNELGTPIEMRSADGARRTAVGFVLTGQRLLELSPTQVPAVIREMTAAGSGDVQTNAAQEQLRHLRDQLAGGSGPVRYLQAVLATRVVAFTPDRARVSVWSVGVLSRKGAVEPQAGWTTSTFDLVWERGGWRIWSETIEVGPTPAPNASGYPTAGDAFAQALAGFEPWQVAG